MYKKTLEYTNAFGDKVKSTKYFNLTNIERIRLNNKYGGNIKSYAHKYEDDPIMMIPLIEDLILMSYGVKSEDGESFIKNEKLKEEFENSFFYAELFDNLLTDETGKNFQNFMKGVLGISDEAWNQALESVKLD